MYACSVCSMYMYVYSTCGICIIHIIHICVMCVVCICMHVYVCVVCVYKHIVAHIIRLFSLLKVREENFTMDPTLESERSKQLGQLTAKCCSPPQSARHSPKHPAHINSLNPPNSSAGRIILAFPFCR